MARPLRERAKAWAVAALLTSVLSIAFPFGPLAQVEEVLQPALAYAGIDVSHTPLTADMMLMHDRHRRRSFYAVPLDVLYRTPVGETAISWSELPFYSFRVPFILLVEKLHWGDSHGAELAAVCRTLRRLRGPGTALQMRSVEPRPGGNQWHACP